MFNIQLLIKHEGSGHLPIIRSGLLFTNFLCLHMTNSDKGEDLQRRPRKLTDYEKLTPFKVFLVY